LAFQGIPLKIKAVEKKGIEFKKIEQRLREMNKGSSRGSSKR
jgi:hypothetical protein